MTTRFDPRYVQSHDDRAILRAWLNDADMGGWTDSDADAFFAAVVDEASAQLAGGETLDEDAIRIERIHDACADCGEMIERPASRDVPSVRDDEAWEQMAALHMPGCEWIATRAYQAESEA